MKTIEILSLTALLILVNNIIDSTHCEDCIGVTMYKSRGMDCLENGLQPVSCHSSFKIGVKILYRCKPFYIPSTAQVNEWREATCYGENIWDGYYDFQDFTCEPEYGRLSYSESKFFNGLAPIGTTPLVFNGFESDPKSFPWHASIFVSEPSRVQYTCGGTLIKTNIILTALHCVWYSTTEEQMSNTNILIPTSNLVVLLGSVSGIYEENFGTKNPRLQYLQKVGVTHVVPYGEKIKEGDMALLKLERHLDLTAHVRPAKLPTPTSDLPSDGPIYMQINGFGATSNNPNGTPSSVLLGTKLSLDGDSECGHFESTFSRSKELCITTINSVSGICTGDSGGGAFYQDDQLSHTWVLQGVVSRGIGETGLSCYSILIISKVQSFLSWINTQLRIIAAKETVQEVSTQTPIIKAMQVTAVKESDATIPTETPRSGDKAAEIAKLLNYPKAKVYRKGYFSNSDLIDDYDFGSPTYEGGCYNLNGESGSLLSVETFGTCVRLFSKKDCSGQSVSIYPKVDSLSQISDISDLQLFLVSSLLSPLFLFKSIGPCLSNEFKNAVTTMSQDGSILFKKRNHTQPEDALIFPGDDLATTKYKVWSMTKGDYYNKFVLGPKGRLDNIIMKVKGNPHGGLVDVPSTRSLPAWITAGIKTDDVLTFIIPPSIGGFNNATFNVLPLSAKAAAAWVKAVAEITESLSSGFVDSVQVSVVVYYKNILTLRPVGLLYWMKFDSVKIRYGYIIN